MIDLIKSPRQILMDETGLPQLETGLLNNTQPYGVQGHATGGAISEKSPEDMIAEMIYGGQTPSKFQYAGGGWIKGMAEKFLPFAEREANKAKFLEPSKEKGVMYHATNANFNEFQPNKSGMHFVTPDRDFANEFIGEDYGKTNYDAGANIMPVHVQVKNPFDYEKLGHLKQLFRQAKDQNINLNQDWKSGIMSGNWDALEDPNIVKAIKNIGHDAMHVSEYSSDGEPIKNLAIFDPSKIKSAIGNQGTYDVTNPDIRKADGGVIDKALPHVGHAFALDPLYELAKAIASQKWGHALQSAGDLAQVYSPMKAALPAQLATYSPELNSNEDAELAARRAMPPLSTIQPNR